MQNESLLIEYAYTTHFGNDLGEEKEKDSIDAKQISPHGICLKYAYTTHFGNDLGEEKEKESIDAKQISPHGICLKYAYIEKHKRRLKIFN
jgi:hypothetical protein